MIGVGRYATSRPGEAGAPEGPSNDPEERRLALPTEDHPLDDADFAGVVPDPGRNALTSKGARMSNMAIYFFGVVIVSVAMYLGLEQLGIGMTWRVIAILFVVGFGLMGAVSSARRREESPADED